MSSGFTMLKLSQSFTQVAETLPILLLLQAEEGRAAPGEKPGAQQKWVSNYVPYGDLPAGKAAAAAAEEDETAKASTSAATSSSNGVEQKWKKNYVPYKEGDAAAKE